MGTKNKVLKEIVSKVERRVFDMKNAYETLQEAHKQFKPDAKKNKQIDALGKMYEKEEKLYIEEGVKENQVYELEYMDEKIKLIKSGATQVKLQKATNKYNKVKQSQLSLITI
jgi:ClpP class serine protease